MRIPHVIDKNTLLAYEPSATTLTQLLGELRRVIRAEDYTWDSQHIPSLSSTCIKAIAKNFTKIPILYYVPPYDKEYLLEEIPTDLPLELCVPLITDDYYWERRYRDNFPEPYARHDNWTWKCLYLERNLQKLCEEAEPQYKDEESIRETAQLCCDFIHVFRVTQLKHWVPPKTWDEDEIPEVHPTTHINLRVVLEVLPYVRKVEVCFGMYGIGMEYVPHMFKVASNDCEWIGESAAYLTNLQYLKIHRCAIGDRDVQLLVRKLLVSKSLIELDLSHCKIGDLGALYLSNLILDIDTLKILKLRDNNIGELGCTGIGTVLLDPKVSLYHLDMSFNPLRHDATIRLMSALVRGTFLRELIVSGCGIEGFTSILVGRMIKLNSSLIFLDISNNCFGKDGGEALLLSLETNLTLQKMDLRDTDIPEEMAEAIKSFLLRNTEYQPPKEDSDASQSYQQMEAPENLIDKHQSIELMNYEF